MPVCTRVCVFYLFLNSLLAEYLPSKAISLRCLNALSNKRHIKRKNRLPTYFITSLIPLEYVANFISNIFFVCTLHLTAHHEHSIFTTTFFSNFSLTFDLKPQQIKIALLSVSMIECALKTNENKRERQVHIVIKLKFIQRK